MSISSSRPRPRGIVTEQDGRTTELVSQPPPPMASRSRPGHNRDGLMQAVQEKLMAELEAAARAKRPILPYAHLAAQLGCSSRSLHTALDQLEHAGSLSRISTPAGKCYALPALGLTTSPRPRLRGSVRAEGSPRLSGGKPSLPDAAQEGHDLTPTQRLALLAVQQSIRKAGFAALGEIAHMLGIRPQAALDTLCAIVGKGYLSRRPDGRFVPGRLSGMQGEKGEGEHRTEIRGDGARVTVYPPMRARGAQTFSPMLGRGPGKHRS